MDAPENLHQVTSSEHLQELLSEDLKRVSLLYFWAPWAEPCKQMTEVVKELTRKYPEVLSLQIEAEEQSEIAESFDIGSVPLVLLLRVRRHLPPSHFRLRLSFFFLTQGHTLLTRIEGADAAALTTALTNHVRPAGVPLSQTDKVPATGATITTSSSSTPEELDERLSRLMNQSKVVLFMKGSPDEPRCGFSRKICGLLKEQGVDFSHFDILKDEKVRQGEPRPFVTSSSDT